MEYNVGAGLVDFLVIDQVDPDTGDDLPSLGIINDDDGLYKKFDGPTTLANSVYLMKANPTINTECYAYTQAQIRTRGIHFLINEAEAKLQMEKLVNYKKMTPLQRAEYMKPYTQTSILREQMMNLVREDTGEQIKLKPVSPTMGKDKFSALIYALYYCKLEEERGGRKFMDIDKMMMFTPGKTF